MNAFNTDVAIIGAGLCGLRLADRLSKAGRSPMIFDARDRVGGRILSRPGPSSEAARYDLGPAWIWPHNTRMLALVDHLGLPLMAQHAAGNLAFEAGDGTVRRDLEFATMGGALRVEGGLARVAEALAKGLSQPMLRLGHRVDHLSLADSGVRIEGQGPDGPFRCDAARVAIALPPRLLQARVAFAPPLTSHAAARLRAVPTWMAGHGKVVAIYRRAFWRAAGLSGDGISHRGPLVEIHDASPDGAAQGEAALFGFIAPGAVAQAETPAFREAVLRQLAALFGPEAGTPADLQIVSWQGDPDTATDLDRDIPRGHPAYGPQDLGDPRWDERVLLTGAETAPENGGFLEGALEAADRTARALGIATD